MNCEELIAYLSDYIDQDMTEELRVDAQEHLATCHNCRVVLDTTQQMIFLYRQSGRQSIPAKQRGALFSRIEETFKRRNY